MCLLYDGDCKSTIENSVSDRSLDVVAFYARDSRRDRNDRNYRHSLGFDRSVETPEESVKIVRVITDIQVKRCGSFSFGHVMVIFERG